jgi:hypothetical protein
VNDQAQLTVFSKGRVESGVKYLRRNFWPTTKFTTLADLNQQVQAWVAGVAHERCHGTTFEQPGQRLLAEHTALSPLPARERLVPFLRQDYTVARDGYIQLDRSWYGLSQAWAGKTVQLQVDEGTVQIWAGEQRLAVHPRALHAGQRFRIPGQWTSLRADDNRPQREPLAIQVPAVEVQQRSLAMYDNLLEMAG